MRLIDADALLEKMKRTSRYFQVKFDIEEAPTIEAEPVVRSKDCKTYSNGSCWIMRGKMKPYDFCNYGERGEE